MTEIETTKAAPIELSEELAAALASDEPLSDEMAERIADEIKPREDNGPRTYGQPSKWVIPVARTIGRYVTRSDVDQLALTEPTKAAWKAVESAHDVVQEARAELESIEADRAVETRAADEAVAVQVRADKAPKLPAGRDWSAVERTRSAVLRVRIEELGAARAAYDKVAKAQEPKRRANALAKVEATRSRARAVVPAALAAFAEYRAAVNETTELFAALEGPSGQVERNRRHLTEDASRTLREGTLGTAAVATLLASEHPWLSGSYLADRGSVEPPLWAREAIADGRSNSDFAELCQIEVREDFAVTKYGYQHALATGMIRPRQRRPMGP